LTPCLTLLKFEAVKKKRAQFVDEVSDKKKCGFQNYNSKVQFFIAYLLQLLLLGAADHIMGGSVSPLRRWSAESFDNQFHWLA